MPKGDHIIIFEHLNLRGRHRHIFVEEPDLNHPDDNTFENKVSSWSVVTGKWEFFQNNNYTGAYGNPNPQFGPGEYPLGFPAVTNDTVSSLRSV
jgi:Beta/Gamma crystallin